ncbi:putative phage protein gp47/JayE [Paenibacillus jamilae]|uniref:baseplate J/gp47 family protein n=1 Tax=unclassified Paenibacillus TaxID=185978 RepID=UPI00142DA360|nr:MULTISPECIES: baseplate J/gp47 family protein [unclassified Paenibacillus]MDP9676055.1 putative phage protein gp47/JayE [Paenibacillus jamilae]KAF6618410.1 baseplate J/gp47 family protein [Paenibacillus sp. EKM101P]KAF6624756.1 baseplate J/gp47 family protein [Paenibacillus sp. EKM102P]KAF6635464.1 baseplate J/gp47 family protein [Paenibacillus sp. EKM10P]KAF6648826.1 baseplate J/gp47 family protein [Paenibacillus sp. EKM11P]
MADLPEYLVDQTEEEILNRMLEKVPSDIDKSEGSFIWDAQAPVAFMLSEAAIWAQELLRRGFASTAASDNPDFRSPELDLRTAEHGVTRREAVAASGKVKFTGTAGTIVPAGTLVATPADDVSGEASIEYATTTSVTLDEQGTGEAAIRAVNPGRSGNVPAGVIQVMATPISGVSSVINTEETKSGTDIESDQLLLERFYAKVRNQGTSGNKAQYTQWANEIAGVGGVEVVPLWKGPGTVGLYVLDTDKRAASPEIVAAVQKYIDPTQDGQGEGLAPAGPVVTIMPAAEVEINISVKVQRTKEKPSTLDEIKKLIENGVRTYLKQLAFYKADPLVRYTRISAVLLDIPIIIDFSELKINGQSNQNIEIGSGQVAVLGTVSVGE